MGSADDSMIVCKARMFAVIEGLRWGPDGKRLHRDDALAQQLASFAFTANAPEDSFTTTEPPASGTGTVQMLANRERNVVLQVS